MARIPLRPLIEYAFRTKNNNLELRDWVLARRRDGASWLTVSEELTERTDGLSLVSDQTVRIWFFEDEERESAERDRRMQQDLVNAARD